MDGELKQFGDWWTQTHGRAGLSYLDLFLRGYVECALWSSTDDDWEPLDAQYTRDDIDAESLAKMRDDCRRFMASAFPDGIDAETLTGRPDSTIEERAGHDFWLTRNGHGAGFWDGDWTNGDELTEKCKAFKEVALYVGDDGKIYQGQA